LDLAVPNEFDNNVSIFLGSGNGIFHEPLYCTAGERPNAVAMGDFDVDGHLDLAFPTWAGELLILLGNGDGTFQYYTQYEFSDSFYQKDIATWDFDEDGYLDLALAASNNVPILLGNGDGTFQDAVKYGGGTGSMTPGDFDEDGHQDMAITSYDSISILLNRLDHDEDGHIGIVHGGEDCDDEDTQVHPGAPEVCDGKDDDCDGHIPADEVDADSDGWMICAGDCDDAEPLANPGMEEIQGDGIDNDCDGYVDESCFVGSVI